MIKTIQNYFKRMVIGWVIDEMSRDADLRKSVLDACYPGGKTTINLSDPPPGTLYSGGHQPKFVFSAEGILLIKGGKGSFR